MALDDRDRNFEKALARQMRTNASEAFDCPDAETLAAYHDRMLSPEEMTAQKSHIAACPRCQEILATLEITEAIPSGAEDSEKIFEKPTVEVLGKAVAMAATSAKSASVREMSKRKTYLRWAVPAGAIAAGLLIWVSLDSSRKAKMPVQTSAPVEIAENRQQKAPELLAVKPADEATAPTSRVPAKTSMGERDRAKQELELDAGKLKGQDKIAALGKTNARTYDHGPRIAQNQTQNSNQYRVQNGIQNQDGALYKSNETLTVSPRVEPPPANAPQRAEVQAKAVPPAPATASEAVSADMDARKDAKTDSLAASSEVTTGVAGAKVQTKTTAKEKKAADAETKALRELQSAQSVSGFNAASLRDTGMTEERFVHSPDSRIFWFIAPGGQVFKTEDAGKTIHGQEIGPGMKALGGSSPDANVCWIVAQNGTLLRTVDGGNHWVKISAPESVNFTSVSASDALHAVISDASGKVRYSTADGGATWIAALP